MSLSLCPSLSIYILCLSLSVPLFLSIYYVSLSLSLSFYLLYISLPSLFLCFFVFLSRSPPPLRWPRTLAGITAYLPCNKLASGTGIYSGSVGEERRAQRNCDRGGLWAEGDYFRCQYQKDVTRFLYIINQVTMTLCLTMFDLPSLSVFSFFNLLYISRQDSPLDLLFFSFFLLSALSFFLSSYTQVLFF